MVCLATIFLTSKSFQSTTINVYRLQREVGNDRKSYSLSRTILSNHGHRVKIDAKLTLVYPHVPEAKWGKFLHGTFWAREPDIIDEVVVIWKS